MTILPDLPERWRVTNNMREISASGIARRGVSGLLFAALVLGLAGGNGRLLATSVTDFDNMANDQGTYELAQNLNPPAPRITNDMMGGNNFLRMTWGVAANISSFTYDITDPGLFDRIETDFDFRITGTADGFGFLLLSTAIYAQKEVVPRQNFVGVQVYQEPVGTNSLGIGFDIHQGAGEMNDNHLSVHFNNVLLQEFDAGSVDLNSGDWIHAKIIARPGDGFSDVSVILTPTNGTAHTVFTNYFVMDFVPDETRPHWGARTGPTETSTTDLDNINVQFIDPAPVVFEFGFTNFATVEEVPA